MPAEVLFYADARREGQVGEYVAAVEVEPYFAGDLRLEPRKPFADTRPVCYLYFRIRRRTVVRECGFRALVEH